MAFLGEKDVGTKNVNSSILRPLAGNPASDVGPPHMSAQKEEEEKGEQISMDFTVVEKNSRQLLETTLFRGGRKVLKRRETTLSE